MRVDVSEVIISKAIAIASSLVGTKEELGANRGKIVDLIEQDFKTKGVAWCVMFVWHCYNEASKAIGAGTIPLYFTASSQALYNHYKNEEFTFTDPMKLRTGDIAIWQNGTSWTGHAGLVTGYYSPMKFVFPTIEGNTSTDDKGSQDNGDGVYRKIRRAKPDSFTGSGFHLRGFIDIRKVLNG